MKSWRYYISFLFVCIVTFPAGIPLFANDAIREDFTATGVNFIDERYAPETPRQTNSNNGHAFTWGGFQRTDKATGIILDGDTGEVGFANGNPYTYVYTIFDSSGGNTSDISIDLSGPTASIEAYKTNGSDGWTFRFMVRDRHLNWYIADTTHTGPNGARTLMLATDGPSGSPVTWTSVNETTGTLNDLSGSDEQILVLGNPGLLPDATGANGPDLSAVTGGGIYCVSYGGVNTKKITYIEWKKQNFIEQAFSPYPADGSTALQTDRFFSWNSGGTVTSYNVYFGIDSDLRFAANTTDKDIHFSKLAAAAGQEKLTGQTYQWRVDSLDTNAAVITEGTTWTVTIPNYIPVENCLIEDFISYLDTNDLLTTWQTSANATAMLDDPYGAIKLNYNNSSSPYFSQVTLQSKDFAGWEYDDLKAISVAFKGLSQNSTSPIYIIISDSTKRIKVVHNAPNATRNDTWQTWQIDLTKFTDLGLIPADVQSISLGVGMGLSASGSGTVYFDDVTLYPSRCLADRKSPADIDADCDVDIDDLLGIATQWLIADYTVNAIAPSTDNLRASYSFEETAGTTASDSSQLENDAVINPGDATTYWISDGQTGSCIEITGELEVVLPASLLTDTSDNFTISMWIKGNPVDWPNYSKEAGISAGTAPCQNNPWDYATALLKTQTDYADIWNHYAAVKDAAAETLSIYHNGILIALKPATAAFDGNEANETVIRMLGGSGGIKLDELKIYSTALSHQEIVYLAAGTEGEIIQPIQGVVTNNDIAADGVIDLSDVALIMKDWLTDSIWPSMTK